MNRGNGRNQTQRPIAACDSIQAARVADGRAYGLTGRILGSCMALDKEDGWHFPNIYQRS